MRLKENRTFGFNKNGSIDKRCKKQNFIREEDSDEEEDFMDNSELERLRAENRKLK